MLAITTVMACLPAQAAPPAPFHRTYLPLGLTGSGQGTERVPAALFGLHDASRTAPHIDAIRLWDDGTRWDLVCPEQNACHWDQLDETVESALSRGAREILYVLGSTPTWAAAQTSDQYYFGPGTASVPRDLTTWRRWVRSVVERYKGRITAYEIWNEANLSAFFAGTPQEMAELTHIAAEEIRAVDPAAKIVTPSVVLRQGRTGWLAEYLAALRDTGTQVDAINVHGYVWRQEGPGNGSSDQRRQVIRTVDEVARSEGFTEPLWDTEVNFGNTRSNGWPTYLYAHDISRAMLARSFVDSQRLGVARQFWYAWDKQVMSVNLTNPSGSVTPVGRAYYRLRHWMVGARWLGCHVKQRALMCGLVREGRVSMLVMTERLGTPAATLRLGSNPRWVCRLDSSCQLRRKVDVRNAPILVHLGRRLSRGPSDMTKPVPLHRHGWPRHTAP